MTEQELTLPQRVQQLEEADERLTEIVNNLLEETLAFQMVIRSRLKTIFFHLMRLSSKWIMAI